MRGGPDTILVVGTRDLDSGKTTVARALLRLYGRVARGCCGFKPKAGNNLWYDYDVVSKALSQGRLFGKDAQLLKESSCTPLVEEQINPIHRLHPIPRPPGTASTASGLFIVDRVSTWKDRHHQLAVVNKNSEIPREMTPQIDLFLSRCDDVRYVRNVEELNQIASTKYEEALASAYRYVRGMCDTIIYESFSNVAVPWMGMDTPDAVLAVGPGRILLFDPDRYFEAVRMLSGMLRETSTEKILELLTPLKKIEVPPLSKEIRIQELERRLSQLIQ